MSSSLPALTGRTRQFERCSNSRVRPVVGQALSDRSTCRRVGQACPISSWDRLHRTSRDRSDKSVRPVGSRFGRTVSVRPPVEHGCSSTARAAVFDRLMPAVHGSLKDHVARESVVCYILLANQCIQTMENGIHVE
ncbi:hypothetical protein PCANC_26043 [Puccinia coronata f. sp. avenae]|uniref:Uncharacterized protein n=1 Tax=Puccinia coronata f. sp. avenae TaxID=200324 RepID=A0A2N5SE01_9BASI|nr:hypothetical protein PCANC_26043 [Puccinia coronata f. sp. avenae]